MREKPAKRDARSRPRIDQLDRPNAGGSFGLPSRRIKRGAREKDPGLNRDARDLKLEATRKGTDLHSRIARDLVEEMKELVAPYDPDTRGATTRLISRLARNASERFGTKRAAHGSGSKE